MQIRKAERRKAKLRLGLCGAPGSGKTRSALEIAHGMGGKIGMIDTESGRGELYANTKSKHDASIILKYDVLRLEAPFSPDRYIEAMQTFEQAGYDILIIDSLSHAWAGKGGVLEIADQAGGQFQNGWKKATPMQNKLVDAIIASKMHIICNFRSKVDYVMEPNEKGKYAPRKIGLAPIQKDQIEYEFTVFMNFTEDNHAQATKDNTELLGNQPIKPSPSLGVKLMDWLNCGVDDSDNFRNVIVPEILEVLEDAKTLGELQLTFNHYYKLYSESFTDDFSKVIEFKDKRKEQIKLMEMEVITPPVITKSAYSQALVTGTQQ